jgi:hypothetical protein
LRNTVRKLAAIPPKLALCSLSWRPAVEKEEKKKKIYQPAVSFLLLDRPHLRSLLREARVLGSFSDFVARLWDFRRVVFERQSFE